eukprot:gb/GFBE01076003.1/.p1 GENE.gb/GFBE01076003.1/~~gb/GFBE01076003.1/.p1  ORF type:complete len:387 (+),score=75.67 gb/GFBE01076003.1/:1-1161(+)
MAVVASSAADYTHVPHTLLSLDTSPLEGLLQNLLRRLEHREASALETETKVNRLTHKHEVFMTSLAARVDKLELEFDTEARMDFDALEQRLKNIEEVQAVAAEEARKTSECCNAQQTQLSELLDDCNNHLERTSWLESRMEEFESLNIRQRLSEAEASLDELVERNREVDPQLEELRVKLAQTMTDLDKLDCMKLREELLEACRTLEARAKASLNKALADVDKERQRARADLDSAVSRFRTQMADLMDGAMENLRQSLNQKVLMLDPADADEAAGTRYCISCSRNRSQSPKRPPTTGVDGHVYATDDDRPVSAQRSHRASYAVSAATKLQQEQLRPGSARYARSGRPGSAARTSGGTDKYDNIADAYARMTARCQEKSIGKLVAIA